MSEKKGTEGNQGNLGKLPKGWVWTRLEDVADVIRGISFPKEARTNTPQDDYVACLRTTNVQREVEWENLWFVPRQYVRRQEQFVQPHDILISTANSLELVGKVAEVKAIPFVASIGAFISTIRVSQELEPRFVYFQLTSTEIQSALRETASTTTNISNISTTSVLNTDLKIAPLPEQQRIVAKIEELFSDLDAGVAALQKTKTELKRYRQAVLKAAVEGKLTAEWRAANAGKVESADKLLERIRAERAKSGKGAEARGSKGEINAAELPALPEGWCWARLDDVSTINPRIDLQVMTDDLDVTFLPMRCVEEETGQLDLSLIRKITEVRKGYTYFTNGDLLFAKITPCMENGKVAIAHDLRNGIGFGSTEFHVIRLPGFLPRRFFFYFLLREELRKEARRNMTGSAGQLRVPANFMQQTPVALPPLAEQQQIVAEVERHLSVAEQVEKTVDASLKQAERLRQSILRQAFAGKLVPQDPGDESAERLLERIRARKETRENKTQEAETSKPKQRTKESKAK